MKSVLRAEQADLPSLKVDVVEPGNAARPGNLRCGIDEHVSFDTSRMESFFFAKWEPVFHDAFLVAAAVEFCDMTKRRPTRGWGRHFKLRIPVHNPERWVQDSVSGALRDALEFLTSDRWSFEFYARENPVEPPRQGQFNLNRQISAVIPFSDGLDSCAAARLAARQLGDRLVRVRLGSKDFAPNGILPGVEPFTAVPYSVRRHKRSNTESSARSRGFKFSLISGIAAYLADADKIIVPESGQGALGPSLIPVGHAYPDYRSHPRFGRKMEAFFRSLLGFQGRYDYPHIWDTKGETLTRFIETSSDAGAWTETRSCWQQNRQVGMNGRAPQCGICAACMLRRLSVHAAGETESSDAYVWEDLGAQTFREGASPDFDEKRITGAMEEYAIAGALHLDHLAALSESPANKPRLNLECFWLSQSLDLPLEDVKKKLEHLLARHKYEWENFMASLGPDSFVAKWVNEARL